MVPVNDVGSAVGNTVNIIIILCPEILKFINALGKPYSPGHSFLQWHYCVYNMGALSYNSIMNTHIATVYQLSKGMLYPSKTFSIAAQQITGEQWVEWWGGGSM